MDFWTDLKSGKFASMVGETVKGRELKNSVEAFNMIKPMCAAHPDVEKVYCIFFNSKNRILSLEVMSSGTLTAAAVYAREFTKRVMKLHAAAIMIAHNHPSGDNTPSVDDFEFTGKLWLAMHAIGVTIHDHIIIADKYYSMADSGRLEQIGRWYAQLDFEHIILFGEDSYGGN